MRLLADDLDGLNAMSLRETRDERRARPLPWLRMGLLSAGMVAGLAYLAAPHRPAPSEEPAAIPLAPLLAPPPVWQAVAHPEPLYLFEGIDPTSYAWEVRRHVSGGREDTLTFGNFGEAGYGRLTVTDGATDSGPASFYVDLVRQSAQAGLSVVRSTQAAPLATKFGPAEIAAVTMAGATQEACLALRVVIPEAPFSLRGWVCGSAQQPAGDAQLVCLLDRLTLVGGEPGLKALFAWAERRRAIGCAPARPHMESMANEGIAGGEAGPGIPERTARPTRSSRASRSRRL